LEWPSTWRFGERTSRPPSTRESLSWAAKLARSSVRWPTRIGERLGLWGPSRSASTRRGKRRAGDDGSCLERLPAGGSRSPPGEPLTGWPVGLPSQGAPCVRFRFGSRVASCALAFRPPRHRERPVPTRRPPSGIPTRSRRILGAQSSDCDASLTPEGG